MLNTEVLHKPPALGFLYRAMPPTNVASTELPTVKVLLEKNRWKRSTCGSILRKASQAVMKPAICSTPVGLRCCSSKSHSLRSPRRNQCAGYPSPRSWKVRKDTTLSR